MYNVLIHINYIDMLPAISQLKLTHCNSKLACLNKHFANTNNVFAFTRTFNKTLTYFHHNIKFDQSYKFNKHYD